ncbi:MAG: hypothetical protein K9N23_04340 [Akkermansiaceae bacterium]|nr:hypothetical protein [Akkermansiaceae bacterium]
MKFACQGCGQRIEAADTDSGGIAGCPSCGCELVVPNLAQSGPEPPAIPDVQHPKAGIETRILRKRRPITVGLVVMVVTALCFWLLFGVFVIQPIGALPDGATVVYCRQGLNMKFIESADGILKRETGKVTLFGRGIVLGKIGEIVAERKVISLPYFHILYLWSTGGSEYDR